MISVTNSGSFNNIENFLKKNKNIDFDHYLDTFGQAGVEALSKATPKDTGLTSESWYYQVEKKDGLIKISWHNSNVVDDWYNVAIGIQYGHGTANGTYVQGIDYINPAMQSIFDEFAQAIWEEVTTA